MPPGPRCSWPHMLCPWVAWLATQVCCPSQHPAGAQRKCLQCEAPAHGRLRCPVGRGHPPGAPSQRRPALPGTSCPSRGGGAGPWLALASPLRDGCLHSAPGEGRKAGRGPLAILDPCLQPRALRRGWVGAVAPSHGDVQAGAQVPGGEGGGPVGPWQPGGQSGGGAGWSQMLTPAP